MRNGGVFLADAKSITPSVCCQAGDGVMGAAIWRQEAQYGANRIALCLRQGDRRG